jgi:hypothetical protein
MFQTIFFVLGLVGAMLIHVGFSQLDTIRKQHSTQSVNWLRVHVMLCVASMTMGGLCAYYFLLIEWNSGLDIRPMTTGFIAFIAINAYSAIFHRPIKKIEDLDFFKDKS